MPRATLSAIYGQETGLAFLKKYCSACGRLVLPQEIASNPRCGHTFCPGCSSAQMPCMFCQRLK